MKERVVIVFVAVVLGLLITTIGFFLYQSTKIIPGDESKQAVTQGKVTPTPENTSQLLLVVQEPKDQSITDKRTIVIKGKTDANNTIIVSTNQEDTVAAPNALGEFSVSISIDAGANKVITRAISPDGIEKTDMRTITFSTEEF